MLTEDEKREIREVIRECFSEFLSEQGLSTDEHTEDHKYIRGLQEASTTIKKASLWTLVSTIIAAIFWAMIHNS